MTGNQACTERLSSPPLNAYYRLSKDVARRGTAYLLPPLSSGGASPSLCFPIGGFRHFPMTDPIASRQRLPGGTHRETPPLHGA
jgi:hypothetical protein